MQHIGDAVRYRHLHLISLPLDVLDEKPACDAEWLTRLAWDADRAGWEKVAQLFAAVYVHSQSFHHNYAGYVSAVTGTDVYMWTIGTPPSWNDTGSAVSFSKLDMFRLGPDQGNECYYDLHASAMQLAFPGKDGLVPAIELSKHTKRSVGNVVETVLGMCAALYNDYLVLSIGK